MSGYANFTKIDIFSHIMTEGFVKKYVELNPSIQKRVEFYTYPVHNLEIRRKLQSRYPDVLQVVTMANIPLEKFCPNDDAPALARLGNEELAELLLYNPDLFFGAVACLPMQDVDASLEEIDYALGTLKLDGIQVFTRINGEKLSDPKFLPIFEKMAAYNKPIWIHPDTNNTLDWDVGVFSWPYETSVCMFNLVQSGLFNKFPDLKIIVHHAGAMAPFFKERIKYVLSNVPQPFPNTYEHFKKFYVDTAVYGNTDALMTAYNYYGADHMFFGTDAPLGPRWGMVEDTIASIDRMAIPDEDKEKILKRNAIDLFKCVV